MDSALYRKLNPRKHEIRILTILPTISSSPLADNDPGSDTRDTQTIRCTLETESLDDGPSYTALSYVWGPELPCNTILVNDQILDVGQNLGNALRHIRHTDHSIRIWADAICINQEDPQEKADQIQMMAQIYQDAAGVFAWLGPAENESDAAMDKIKDIGPKAIEAGMQDFRAATDMPNWFRRDADERLSKLRTSLNSLAEREGLDLFHQALIPLSQRRYWTRVWILQEVCLPRDLTILCGLKRIDLATFIAAFNFFAFARWTLGSRFKPEDYNDPESQLRSVVSNPPSGAPNALFGARRRYYSETGKRDSLASLLKRTCVSDLEVPSLNAKDPRDKIYGLLAATSDCDDLEIVPNYGKSVVDVYTDACRAMIARGQVDILCLCQHSTVLESGKLPSWVPNFSVDLRHPCGEDRVKGPLFCASGNAKFPGLASTSLCTDRYSLALAGVKVDTIANLGTGWKPKVYDIRTYWDDAQRLLDEVEAICKQSPLLTSDFQISDACMRIPCADQEGTTRARASGSIRSRYDLLKSQKTLQFDREANAYRKAMEPQRERKPFRSTDGHVGLAPERAELGDWICIILGATVPFILRAETTGQYRLIGEAYVYGIMDGEWLKDDRPTTTFCLV